MADTKSLLEVWDLSEYVNVFLQNKITVDLFQELNEGTVAELLPIISDRIKFNAKLKEFISENKQESNPSSKRLHDELIDKSAKIPAKRPMRGNASINYDEAMSDIVVLHNFDDITSILEASEQGLIILDCYEQTKDLTKKARNKLVDILFLEARKQKKHMTLLRGIAEAIVKKFPTESRSTYFTSPIKKCDSGVKNKSLGPKGKLANKQYNFSKQTHLGHPKDIEEEEEKDDEETSATEPSESEQTSFMWLETNHSLLINKATEEHWKITAAYRFNIFKNSTENLTDIFDKFPVLKQSKAYTLIEQDFEYLNLTKTALTEDAWQSIYNIICSKNEAYSNDSTSNSLKIKLKTKDLSKNSQVAIQLQLLAHFLPPTAVSKIPGKSSKWKVSIGDCKSSIINHAVIDGDVEKIKSEQRAFALEHKKTLQPYIIVRGEKIENIEECFVIIDEVEYQIESVLQAFVICFKSFHVFNLKYPLESEHLYMIIQKFLEIKENTKWNAEFPTTAHVMKRVDKFINDKVVEQVRNEEEIIDSDTSD
ncbi:hypothetical protein TKK_0007575 [Trichogramma kaykai]